VLGVVNHFSHIVGSQVRVESHFSHVVGNWWAFVFHIVGNWWKVAFRMLGIGGHSCFPHIVENSWKATFLILLGVGAEFPPFLSLLLR
jgi:hypothetical protein